MGGARSGSAAALLLVLVAAGMAFRKPPTPAPAPPPGTLPRVNTGGGRAWARDRLAALERAGVTGDVALSILAQWDVETDGGHGEWNFNVGNLRPVGTEPRVDLGRVGAFRAFRSLDEGVHAYLALVQSGRYTPCWGILTADPSSEDWIRCLGRRGYFCDHPAPCTEDEINRYVAAWRARRVKLSAS